MRTPVGQRGGFAAYRSIENDVLTEDRPMCELTGDEVVRPHRDVPRVAQICAVHSVDQAPFFATAIWMASGPIPLWSVGEKR
jgi:hypothetical protein